MTRRSTSTRRRFDGFISVGGGSVIDTTKAANLYSTHPADFLSYVNAPIGAGLTVPGPLKPHIACPTTSGTGSECTGIAVFDLLDHRAKTGIASKMIRPTRALIDPSVTATLPANVVASSAFDVLSHALESYTARSYRPRPAAERPSLRPSSQGSNPWSDLGCREAHGMSYSVSGLVKDFQPAGYPAGEPIVPHGMSVIVNSPSVFRRTAALDPARHLDAARWLGADVDGAGAEDAGRLLADRIIELMRATGMPNGLAGVGYEASDIEALAAGSLPQRRLLDNAPITIDHEALLELYRGAISYW